MATQSIGVRIGLEGAQQFENDIKGVTQATKTLKSELELASKMKNPFERASSMKTALTSEIKAQEEKIKQLRAAYETAAEETGRFSEKTLKAEDALYKAENALAAMNRQLKDLPNGLENWGDDILKSSEKFSSTGQEFKAAAKPFWGVTGTVVAGLTAATKITADFEQQMAKVKAVTNASESDFDALSNKARQLGETTKFTATEAAEAFEYLGRAGFDAQTAIAMSDSVLALAAADAIEFGDAAEVASNMMHIFGLATDDMAETALNAAHVSDTFAQASRSANTDVLTMAETAKYAAPSFAALGWKIEDMAFAIDLAADYGIKGSQAGTGLRQAFKNLEAPTDKIKEAMAEYGITLDDGTGKAIGFADFMKQLRGVFSDLEVDVMDTNGELKDGEAIMEEYGDSLPITQMEKLKAIADIFGTRAMPTVLALIGTSTEKFNELENAVYNANGVAKEMQGIIQDTTEGQITILLSQLQELAISFGELIIPVLRDVISVAQDFVTKLNGMDEGTRKMIITGALASAAIAPILSGIGGLISGIGGIMSVGGHLIKGTGKLIHLISGVGGVTTSVATMTTGMSTATGAAGALAGAKGIGAIIATAGPYALAAGAIIAAGVLVYKNWDTIKEAGKVLKEETAYHFNNLKETAVSAWNTIKNATGEAWGTIRDAVTGSVTEFARHFMNAMSAMSDGMKHQFGVFKSIVENMGGAIKSAIGGLAEKAKSWGSELASNLANGMIGKIGAVMSAAGKIAQGVKNILGHSTPKEGPLHNDDKWGSHMMQNFIGGINDNIGPLKQAVTKAAGTANRYMNLSGSIGGGYAILPSNRYIDLPDTGNSYQTNMGGISFQIYQQPGQDADELAEIIEEKIVAMEMRRQYAVGAI